MGFIPSECRTVVFSQWYVVIVYDSRWSTLCCRICVLKLNLLVSPRVLSFVFFSFCLTPLYVIVDVLPWNLRNRQQLRGIFCRRTAVIAVLFLPLFLSSSLGSCSRVQCQLFDYCNLPPIWNTWLVRMSCISLPGVIHLHLLAEPTFGAVQGCPIHLYCPVATLATPTPTCATYQRDRQISRCDRPCVFVYIDLCCLRKIRLNI